MSDTALTHDEILDLLPDHVTGRTEDPAAAAIAVHLESCATCRRRSEAWTAVGAAAADVSTVVLPPVPDISGKPSGIIEMEPAKAARRRVPAVAAAVIVVVGALAAVGRGNGEDRRGVAAGACPLAQDGDAGKVGPHQTVRWQQVVQGGEPTDGGVLDLSENILVREIRPQAEFLRADIVLYDDGSAYVFVPVDRRTSSQGRAWLRLPPRSMPRPSEAPQLKVAAPTRYLERMRGLGTLECTAPETVRGVATAGYRLTKTKPFSEVDGDFGNVVREQPTDLWVDRDGRPMRVRSAFEVHTLDQDTSVVDEIVDRIVGVDEDTEPETVSFVDEFWDHGVPEPIRLPAAADTLDVDLRTAYEIVGLDTKGIDFEQRVNEATWEE